jgi:hypothetical protein
MTRRNNADDWLWDLAGFKVDAMRREDFVQYMLENVDQRNLATMRISEEDIDNAMRQDKKDN